MFPYMDSVEEAARRTAINLMRLNEALELREAERYDLSHPPSNKWATRRNQRQAFLVQQFKNWFIDVAGPATGSPDKGTIGSSNGGGPAAISEEQ